MRALSGQGPRGPTKAPPRGFSLLEVVVALSILAISLVVLLQAQSQSLASAGRSRDISIATLLARSKMVDVEHKLFKEGFTSSTQSENGDFADDGFPNIKWKTKVSEVKLDLTALEGMCQSRAEKAAPPGKRGDDQAQNDCASAMGNLTGQVGGLMDELGRSMRAAEVEVLWENGRYQEKMALRALLTREDFQTEAESDMMRDAGALQKAGVNVPGMPGGASPALPAVGR